MTEASRRQKLGRVVMDTASEYELLAIETGSRFSMRLLLCTGLIAGILVFASVVWHESRPTGIEIDTRALP